MAKKKRYIQFSEFLTVTLDDWRQDYSLFLSPGISKLGLHNKIEMITILIAGRPRSKVTGRYDSVEVHLWPNREYLTESSSDFDSIGNVWARKGRLYSALGIPPDSYQAILIGLTAGKYSEFKVATKDMHRGKGLLDSFYLNREITDLNGDVNTKMLAESVIVNPRY